MRRFSPKLVTAVLVGCALALGTAGQASAATPKRGGILNFVVGSKIPSYDLHKETTFGVIHPIAPFYSLLIRINPDNPQSATDFVCDLCEGSVPKPTNGGKTFTFKIRKGVKFHDGTPLTAKDIKATYDRIIFPPEGVPSARKAFFQDGQLGGGAGRLHVRSQPELSVGCVHTGAGHALQHHLFEGDSR
jgi:peptide/nickel transport system substrate-binding protein